MNNRRIVTFFAKSPRFGSVKTRLGRSIGLDQASLLYEAFLADLIARFMGGPVDLDADIRWVYVSECDDFPKLVAKYAPKPCGSGIVTFAAYQMMGLAKQQTEQLRWSCGQGYGSVVHLLTDVPHIPVGYVQKTFELLREFDVVLGPSLDGGYYLFASRAYCPVFEAVELSTNHVFDDMLNILEGLSLRVGLLPTMVDIDNEDDLLALMDLLQREDPTSCPATRDALCALQLV